MLEKVLLALTVILLTLGCGAFIFVFGFCFHGYPFDESLAYAIGTMVAIPLAIAVSLKF